MELQEYLAGLEGPVDSEGVFTLSVERALEFFRTALVLRPILPCIKAVQAAHAAGAREVQVAYRRDRILVAQRGGGAELSQALLDLDRVPKLSAASGLKNYLSWALWGSVADGASQVSWRIGDGWEYALDPQKGLSCPAAVYQGDSEARTVFEVLYPWSWSWNHFTRQIKKNWALNFELARSFAFSPVPVSLGRRCLNVPDSWRIVEPSLAWGLLSPNNQGISERAVGAYTRLAEESPRMALYPPFASNPFPPKAGSAERTFSSMMPDAVCFSHHAAFAYPFYYLAGRQSKVIFHSDMELAAPLEKAIEPALLGLNAPPSQVGPTARRLPLMGASQHALYCPESRDPGSLYLIQDGLLHEPLETGLPGLTLLVACSDVPTDANGVRPVLGAHLRPELEDLIPRLQEWVSYYRAGTNDDGVLFALRNFKENLPGLMELAGI